MSLNYRENYDVDEVFKFVNMMQINLLCSSLFTSFSFILVLFSIFSTLFLNQFLADILHFVELFRLLINTLSLLLFILIKSCSFHLPPKRIECKRLENEAIAQYYCHKMYAVN